MKLKDYARNHKKRKDYVQQPDLLTVLGVYITQDLKIYVKFYHAAFFR